MAHKNISQAEANYAQSTSLVPERIRSGVKGADWIGKAGSDSAEANFKASMTQALANQSRKKGVMASSNQQWEQQTAAAADRAATRMSEEKAKYASRFAPILSAMNSAADATPPRTTDAMANIDRRLKPVVKAAMDASLKGR